MIVLRDYQKRAIESLHLKIEKSLKSSDNEVIVFQAPTGSGKTLMVAALLKDLVQNRKTSHKFSFIWVSVRRLHQQSKEKLEKYYEDGRVLTCSYFEDLEDRKISENEVLFINWHSINKKDINIYVKENEQENNLNNIIQNTKEDGRTIILIIDESHHTASSQKSKDLIEIISPKLTLEVSATPHQGEYAIDRETVRLADVKAEEMIKSEININPEFLTIKIGDKSSDELVIDQALKKREHLAKLYKEEGSNISPLVLVQLPDSQGTLLNKKEEVIEILKKKHLTEDNGKLAVWLSEDKSDTLPNIEKNENEVEVLIFKQAIALGWDCPRASILIIFRESKSFTFTIQTLGRIMRMPELRYYNSEDLNKGYVFTNLPIGIEIIEDYVKDYVTIYESKRDSKLYRSIALPSYYLKRQREHTRLSGKFIEIFSKVGENMKLSKKIVFYKDKPKNLIIAETTILNIDKTGEIGYGGNISITLNENELQEKFDKFVTQCCPPYAPVDSSDRIKSAIYQFFNKKFKLEKYSSKVHEAVLQNEQILRDVINASKDIYAEEIEEIISKKREIDLTERWEVPIVDTYTSQVLREDPPKCAMKPLYTKKLSEPERLFINLLENSEKVLWWYKNRENEKRYFSILRTDEGNFYPDFIVQFKDNSIGIFETKKDWTAKTEEARPRSDGLQKYIKEQRRKGKNIRGGIVVNVNGSWRLNDKEKYSYDEKNMQDWGFLQF